jgi:hypothetical protein
MGRAPNEVPGRPVGKVVPTWSENEDPEAFLERRRATVEWRREHGRRGRFGRWFRRRSSGD